MIVLENFYLVQSEFGFQRKMNKILIGNQELIQDLAKGGGTPDNFFQHFADTEKQSQVSETSQYQMGSRAHVRALKALAFLTVKYVFSHFSGTFSSNFLCTFVWVHYKISISV